MLVLSPCECFAFFSPSSSCSAQRTHPLSFVSHAPARDRQEMQLGAHDDPVEPLAPSAPLDISPPAARSPPPLHPIPFATTVPVTHARVKRVLTQMPCRAAGSAPPLAGAPPCQSPPSTHLPPPSEQTFASGPRDTRGWRSLGRSWAPHGAPISSVTSAPLCPR